MKKVISIEYGDFGLFLKVNGKAIKRNSNGEIKANFCGGKMNNWIATEWVNVKSLRQFWNEYRQIIIHESNK
jgi:hypothetical protein